MKPFLFAHMKISSLDFGDHLPVPERFSCKGPNVSPPSEFLDVPEDAKSLVLMSKIWMPPTIGFIGWFTTFHRMSRISTKVKFRKVLSTESAMEVLAATKVPAPNTLVASTTIASACTHLIACSMFRTRQTRMPYER